MDDLPQGVVCHLTPNRLRIRVRERRHDAAFFDRVAAQLSGWASVERVEVNPLTAGILVHFSDPAALFAENALRNDLFDVDYDGVFAAQASDPFLARAAQSFGMVDGAFRRLTGGQGDLRSAVFLMLLAGGVYQVFRGQIAAPAATLLWYAGAMLGLWDTAGAPPRGGGPRPEPD